MITGSALMSVSVIGLLLCPLRLCTHLCEKLSDIIDGEMKLLNESRWNEGTFTSPQSISAAQ